LLLTGQAFGSVAAIMERFRADVQWVHNAVNSVFHVNIINSMVSSVSDLMALDNIVASSNTIL